MKRPIIHVRVSPDTFAALERVAKDTADPLKLKKSTTLSDIVRQAVEEFLNKRGSS